MGTRKTLQTITGQLDDSMGHRVNSSVPQLSPVPNPKDIGRKGLRDFGQLSIDCVIPDPEQPRVEFDDDAIEQLALSIQEQGQLSPIRVRWSVDHKSWLVISGERRYRAVKKAGLESIECYFQEEELPQSEILQQQLVENLLRCNLKPMEEARAFEKLIRDNSWTGKMLAEKLRISPSRVTRSLSLLRLPEDIQELVELGTLSATAAYEASKLQTSDQQRAALINDDSETTTATPTVATIGRQNRRKKGNSQRQQRGTKQTFLTEKGWKVVVSLPRKSNYPEMEEALQQALEEVRLRIDNNVVLSR